MPICDRQPPVKNTPSFKIHLATIHFIELDQSFDDTPISHRIWYHLPLFSSEATDLPFIHDPPAACRHSPHSSFILIAGRGIGCTKFTISLALSLSLLFPCPSRISTISMTWELTRRRMVRAINSKFIFDRIPVLHAIIFFIEMAIVARLVSRFNAYYDERPVLTMMVTNAVLGGIADTVAQTITSVKQRSQRKTIGSRDDPISIEIQDMSKKDSWNNDLFADPRSPAIPFDFERLTRFMAYGFAMAPIQFKWFGLLSRTFPITKTSAFVPALKRVAVDQIVFAPVSVALFFSVMTIAEGGGRRAVTLKLKDMYLPTLKANFMVWPAVQIINFRLMPMPFQLPFVSTIGIAWTAYLSLSNAAEDDSMHQNAAPYSPNIRLE
ncbi:hypothetical protein F5Y16DRAFT_372655 [Xylariaceae sp. FL0255]|nr:hypothetical protein F5Y16DRAFT_372655 [Xylariaceae sp. FL0255]